MNCTPQETRQLQLPSLPKGRKWFAQNCLLLSKRRARVASTCSHVSCIGFIGAGEHANIRASISRDLIAETTRTCANGGLYSRSDRLLPDAPLCHLSVTTHPVSARQHARTVQQRYADSTTRAHCAAHNILHSILFGTEIVRHNSVCAGTFTTSS